MQNIYDVRDFGAVGDGVTDSTAAIQKAIDTCSGNGGGTVLVSCGTYLFYPLRMRSFVRLEIDWNAVMFAGDDPAKYPMFGKNDVWDVDYTLRNNRRYVIYAEGETHLSICGKGKFDLNGSSFVHVDESLKPFPGLWKRKSDTEIPGRALFFAGCTDVSMEDITLTNPAGWFTWFLKCTNVRVHRVTMTADLRMPNSDGIHLGSCKDVIVSDCNLTTGDDSIIIRSMQEQFDKVVPCENIVITNCLIQAGAAPVRIGWKHDGIHRNISISNLVVRKSFFGFVICIPKMENPQADPPRYGDFPPPKEVVPFVAENISFSNIVAETIRPVFEIELSPEAAVDHISNLSFSHVNAKSWYAPRIVATPEQHVSDITFSDVNLEIPPVDICPNGENAVWHFQNAENIVFNNFRIRRSV